ncbi:MAG: zf-HC2 domain-containing protein [Planctomycetota bacterium]|nr:zf-HC2 domain-containing protein [Planctomycetota bacterium]
MISHAHSESTSHDCKAFREAIEIQHDGEDSPIQVEQLDRHVLDCPRCADFRDELDSLRNLFQNLPEAPFPVEALDEVLADSVERIQPITPLVMIRKMGISLAAAAMLTFAVVGAWFAAQPTSLEEQYTEAELVRLEQDLYAIMYRLGDTVQLSEKIAVHDVLIKETSPIIRVVPLTAPRLNNDTETKSQAQNP